MMVNLSLKRSPGNWIGIRGETQTIRLSTEGASLVKK